MTDGTNPPSHPQPEPAPGSGGYGFPPGPPAQGGYGYPTPSGGYGYPQSGQQPNPYQQDPGAYQQDPAGGFGHDAAGGYQQDAGGYPQDGGGYPQDAGGYPQDAAGGQWSAAPAQPGFTRLAGPDLPGGSQPDWEAMADRSAAERRKKRLWMLGGGVAVLALLAGGGTFFLMGTGDDGQDAQPQNSASASPEPDDSKGPAAYTATVAGDDTLLRDSYGSMGIRLGPDLKVGPLGKRFQVVGKGNGNSWAQSAEPVVDVTKSFTVTARAYNSAAKGSRIIMSQGDGESFSFELGVNEVNGKQAWIFRVQTGDKGAAATTRTVTAEGLQMVKTPTLLMATYDAEKKAIALYVDGKKAGETPVPPIWQAPGPLQLGRSMHHNIWTGPWQGALHNIKTYDMAFTAEQAAGYKEGKLDPSPKPTHAWLLT
ncbi:concanavalin A-like lectin/glucanase superfamily protein [Streptomyces sp. CG 926]|uniref:LamG-like jellyroll fold domain-containing protein n=1 Tax=Streptomyces sp. CG 926 TaxID=1882405 RepID=UPI000D6D0268|nr:LamG-like jellyroll fold domain-containing protein [Streptomyces sp. CG 926]PWK71799.1 concanavalin A-like lectin/glucanase superfamily protein [Streptomyces sp. CG 926]